MTIRRTTTPPATMASEAGRFLGLVDMAPRLGRGTRPGALDRGLPGGACERPTVNGQPSSIIARGAFRAPCDHGVVARSIRLAVARLAAALAVGMAALVWPAAAVAHGVFPVEGPSMANLLFG